MQSGGPSWGVLLGRLDSKTSDFNGSLNLPAPTDNLTVIQQKFSNLSLNDVYLVALSGGHTFGRVQCQFVVNRLYNFSNTGLPDPTMDSAYREFLSQRCPRNGNGSALSDLDPTTPDTFDNHYYTNIEVNRGFLNSDQELKSSPQAKGVFKNFAQSMINMGNIKPLTDPSQGEVRTNCRKLIWSDILALAAEISVELSGGPKWTVLLGRLDSKKSSFKGAENLPSPFDNLTVLEQKFMAVGLHTVDLVALSGAHTIGRVQCRFVTGRLYNFSGTGRPDPTLNGGYRVFLSQRCPQNGNASALNDLDPTTPNLFDNHYYTNLEVNRGFLNSDQELKSSPQAQGVTAPIVDQFATSQDAFFKNFAQSMINMGNIQPLTDPSKGEVRCNCRVAN